MPADNARDYFLKAEQLSRSMKHKSPYDMPGSPLQNYTLGNFRGCAENAEPALKVLLDGLKFPYMAPVSRSSKNTSFKGYANFRELARINAGAADYYEAIGKPGRAMQMRLDGMEMGVMIPRGDGLIGGLVGIACEAIAESRIESLIPLLSSAELKQAADRLDLIEAKRTAYADVILEDGYSQTAEVVEIFKDPKTTPGAMADAFISDNDDDNAKAAWSKHLSHDLAEAKFVLANKQAMLHTNLDWYAAMAQEARGPYTGPSKVSVPNNLIARMSADNVSNSRSNFVRMQAVSAVLRVEIALYRYRKDHGSFPATLALLAPAYLTTVPNDPFGNVPLVYRVQNGGGFLLYSIGPDMKDHGGTPGRFPGDANSDIVAGKMWNRKPILYPGGVKAR
jgi:hypothetical protein